VEEVVLMLKTYLVLQTNLVCIAESQPNLVKRISLPESKEPDEASNNCDCYGIEQKQPVQYNQWHSLVIGLNNGAYR